MRKAGIGTKSAGGAGGRSPGGPASGGGLDPRFSYCYVAIDHGFGPYVRGRDTEYTWYTDSDGDGVVCES